MPVTPASAADRRFGAVADDFAREDNDTARLAIAHRALGYSTHITGAQPDADELLATGASLADSVSEAAFAVYGEDPGVICRAYRGQVRCLRGFLDDAARLADTAVTYARTRSSPFILAWSLIVAAQTHLFRRDASASEEAAQQAITLSREHQLPQWMAFGQQCLGCVLCQQGDWHRGIALQREALDSLHSTGSLLHTTRFRLHLAESFLAIGEVEQSRVYLNAAFAHLRTYREAYLAAELHLAKLKMLKAEGAPDDALKQPIQMGLDVARSQGARLLELRLAVWVARLWRDHDRLVEARNLLAGVYGWFTEGFGTADLKDAKALLDEWT